MKNLQNDSDKIWKTKAIERQVENKNMRKRLKESKASRDYWKLKASQRMENINKLESEIKRIKKNLSKIIG